MSIVLVGSTSGSITLQEPAVAGTTVLTLPATSGTILTTGSSGQSIPKAALPTGSVLQVVSANYSTQTTSSSNVYVDTGLTASITPTSASSKILVMVHQNGGRKTNANSNNSMALRLFRGATNIAEISKDSLYTATALGLYGQTLSISYLDSPATTSSTTYKTQFANISGNAATIVLQQDSEVSTITLMEIAA